MEYLKISRKEGLPFIQSAGINYNGRKFEIAFTNSVAFYDTNWSGGTGNSYYFLSLDNIDNSGKIQINFAPWNNPVEGKRIELAENQIILCHKYFCGKDLGITIYAHPSRKKNFIASGKES